ncbi:hypothetical protein WJX73_006661 [Symbiochloris irregularis]|uniref:glutaredoxin-dependent peroxiredoxin n=1 Tax=Symbiochloris irregularis TaxID=706552 RepID=A0AAW1PGF0_9CHLO
MANVDIPAGHENSDMRPNACNISLNRRRDISLRTDIKLFCSRDDEPMNLKELLRNKDLEEGSKVVLFGVPDMGKVCTDTHAPGYIKQADRLKELGVAKIFAVAVAPPNKVQDWAETCGMDNDKVCAVSDKTGAFARLLGVEINRPEESPPYVWRYAALVEQGILAKLKVEDENGQVQSSSADEIVKILEEVERRKDIAKAQGKV